MNKNVLSSSALASLAAIMTAALLLLQACGGGGGHSSSTPPPISAPAGFFNKSGSAAVKQNDNTTALAISDLQGMVNGNQFMLVSQTENVGYFGTFTSLSGNTYTGTVTIYKDNVQSTTATVTGTIIANTSITGTLTGTGYGNGTFTISYDSAANTAANITRIVRDSGTTPSLWGDAVHTQSLFSFQLHSTGVVELGGLLPGGNFYKCTRNGTVNVIAGTALYGFSVTLSGCNDTTYNGTYTGLAASYQKTNPDDTLVLTMTNGAHAVHTEMN